MAEMVGGQIHSISIVKPLGLATWLLELATFSRARSSTRLPSTQAKLEKDLIVHKEEDTAPLRPS